MKKRIFLALIPCLLLILCSPLSYSGILLDRVIATVNNEVITWSELRRNIEIENKELLKGLSREEREAKIKEIEKPFLNMMVDLKLQAQDAQRLGLNVSPSETNSAINDIKRKYNLKDEDLIDSLEAEGLSLEEYKKRLTEQILLSKIVRVEVSDKIFLSEKEIEEYYEMNKEKYQKEEKVRIRQIFFLIKEGSSRSDLEARAEEVFQQINSGADFASLAGNLSEDASRQFGGDIGYISRGSVLKEIEDVAFSLNVGDVSRPFRSPKGIHIIKLEERIGSGNKEKIKEEIREILFQKAFKLKYEEWIKELREKAYIEIKL